jgi:hypothetical protein
MTFDQRKKFQGLQHGPRPTSRYRAGTLNRGRSRRPVQPLYAGKAPNRAVLGPGKRNPGRFALLAHEQRPHIP